MRILQFRKMRRSDDQMSSSLTDSNLSLTAWTELRAGGGFGTLPDESLPTPGVESPAFCGSVQFVLVSSAPTPIVLSIPSGVLVVALLLLLGLWWLLPAFNDLLAIVASVSFVPSFTLETSLCSAKSTTVVV